MDASSIARRDILMVASVQDTDPDANAYRMPAAQKWMFIVNINAIMFFVFSILFVFMLHQKQFDPLIYKFTDFTGIVLVGVAATILSLALDYAAIRVYRTAEGNSGSRLQCGQILDYSSFFLILTAGAVLAWTAFCFLRSLVMFAPLVASLAE